MVKRICDVCGKAAIGMQLFSCCTSIVCGEHADSSLREMKPGEKKGGGECYYYRFEELSTEGEDQSPP
jgi:hypothetical protein